MSGRRSNRLEGSPAGTSGMCGCSANFVPRAMGPGLSPRRVLMKFSCCSMRRSRSALEDVFKQTMPREMRLHRDKEITDLDKYGAVARLRLLNRGWREILPGDQVRDLATQLMDKHSLRAADSLQLAASLIWCEQRPSRRSFICGDQRLAKAAESAGFSVLELSRTVP